MSGARGNELSRHRFLILLDFLEELLGEDLPGRHDLFLVRVDLVLDGLVAVQLDFRLPLRRVRHVVVADVVLSLSKRALLQRRLRPVHFDWRAKRERLRRDGQGRGV